MKQLKLFIFFCIMAFTYMEASAQDPSLNIVLGSSGITTVGETILLQIDVTNNDPTTAIVSNKIIPQISVPASISLIQATGHILPSGWTIVSNSGSVIRIKNTTDPIPAGTTRTAYIAIQGVAIGNGSVLGNLTFNGPAPSGDNPANNTSSAGLTVTPATVPVTLTDFNATLINCQPVLNWKTETEINSDRFEIETSKPGLNNWEKIGTVAAKGNTTSISNYNFSDAGINANSEKVLYRLKIIDKDGSYKYSDVLSVFVNCKNLQVLVYPNPVQKGKLYVSLSGAGRNTTATLMSVSGQVILKSGIINGTNFINTSGITNGMYILHITDENALYKQVKVFIEK